ncbi:TIGR02530 family flagellar biosynthesis protein [Bacillus sp. T33-2]|uniref:TIGR02530 family flagellar biosynthesis protein n=1 Tax=Bacillus sp. T33-2 TaxID=2054168 RepID=UPI000C759DFC|nr:TIGR02530 family flagellar biosynthesis protein [Bacillus sp. T33-2]PLR97270.1 flagellar protein [Bacillus sp. T33-2]
MDKANFRPIQSQHAASQPLRTAVSKKPVHSPFSLQLQSALQEGNKLTISKHATARLEQRGIHIDDTRWGQIEKKVEEAKKMGVKDSLVLLRDAALIVSAKNNTVITAMDRKEASAQIFTNINGTIVLEN